jgi:hypothetical protein
MPTPVDAVHSASAAGALERRKAGKGHQPPPGAPQYQGYGHKEQGIGHQVGKGKVLRSADHSAGQTGKKVLKPLPQGHQPGPQRLADVYPLDQQKDGQRDKDAYQDLYPPILPDTADGGAKLVRIPPS